MKEKRDSFPIIRLAGFQITFPDLITALNLCAGVGAVYSAMAGESVVAIVLVIGGIFFDYFDGKIARAYHLAHDFGRELDSLADLVTFGIAPGVILFSLLPESDLILAAASLFGVAAAFRLVRFNLLKIRGEEFTHYTGLPVPVAALLLVLATFLTLNPLLLAGLILFLSLLMLSTIKVPDIL